MLVAPTLDDLNAHTDRLCIAARQQDWELVSADGMHHRILNTIASTNQLAVAL